MLSAESALLEEVRCSAGGVVRAEGGIRPDGVRGLMATQDLSDGEVAVWIPNDLVMCEANTDPAIASAVDEALRLQGTATPFQPAEARVFRTMGCLCAGYLLEKARGEDSRFASYVQSLPELPHTYNLWPQVEQQLALEMGGMDSIAMYDSLLQIIFRSIQMGRLQWQKLEKDIPSEKELQDTFFFLLSRMSHLRMIPVADLANAALPGEVTARIVAREDGCGILAKGFVKAGQELCIDYNHREAITMLSNYGCSLGFEHLSTVSRIKWITPPHLHKIFDLGYLEKGVQLQAATASGLSDEELMVLRMSSMWSPEDFVAALRSGYFEGDAALKPPPAGLEDKWQRWRKAEAGTLNQVAGTAERMAKAWACKVGPAVLNVKEQKSISETATALIAQFETDKSLLLRCVKVMKERSAALSTDHGTSALSSNATDSILDELS